ncbi:THO complex subunit 2 [Anopheles ziemanni]|uniref:THO complex subunit 2 n=1 Tax=Anopheles coustani TaxID=139045 RepID=UPI002659271D|nr:THO complex subunit 2 [Anopheles coustani]XP_058167768.1 THO complex subunit 2 [Anopheles ziemanni]
MFNADIWKSWERSGKSEFLKQCKAIVKDDPQQSPLFAKNERKSGISRAIYELISRGIHGQLKKDSVLQMLAEVSSLHSDIPSILLDVFGIFDAETATSTGDAPPSEERSTFCYIVKETERFVSEKLLKERLEIDTLQDVGTIKNRSFYTRFIKVKTKLYYKQRRFNLFREESEGYAKLITELNQEFNQETITVTDILEIIKSLIGCFNLDPNRVLDIILESFEARPEQDRIFIPLLQSYINDGNIICEVLGYKYRYFADVNTPSSLFKVTALLLQHGVIKLDDIYSWLNPTDKSIQADWEAEMNQAKEYVRKLNIILTNKDKEPEQEPEFETAPEKYALNQKWGLCEALLLIGDWNTAHQLLRKLPDQSVMVHEPIARALCRLLHIIIEPVYRLKCALPANIKGRAISSYGALSKLAPPPVTALTKLRLHAFPMFTALGPSLHYDSVLLYKLLRLMRVILTDMNVDPMNPPAPGTSSDQEQLYYDILSLLDASVLPALAYMDCNCCVAEEIWSIVKLYPYQYRYSLYARWKNDTFQLQPKLIQRRGTAQKQIKALMKRVSKENSKPVGRLIGKLSHCSPGFLFEYILLQIQIYDNLIAPVVDSLKYLTSLSYDVLGYCLIEALEQVDRNPMQNDGTSISLWLQSLANFCGAIYKKYNIELSGLLQYVANQLKSHKSLDLLILKEVVQKMAGIEAAEEMTNEQLQAMCGGELLRGEAGYFSQVRNTKKSSQRLKDALASNDLAVALCLLIAQQKHCVIYRETAQSHLKLVGKLYDQCQDTLVQFGTFLGSTYSVEEYVERLPTIHSMLQRYHIHSDVAFFLARPMFSHAINQKYDQLRKADTNAKKLSTSQKMSKYLEATAHVMNPVIESVRPLHPPKIWEDISPQFLVSFWSLSMYDLQVPVESYQREITKLRLLANAVMESKEQNASKNKKEQERYVALMDKLQDERKKQQEHVDKIMHRLTNEKDAWFLSRSAKSAKNETITQFLQLCLFPRCTFTALDAIYCAKFVHTIHNLKTANFSTLLCYDRIFCDITYSVTSCTENEATRYGRFLCAMLETVMRWHSDEATFNKECANYPGFVTKFRVSNQYSEAIDHVNYENYRHVCHKWHYKITKAMVFCLDSKDYMQIRNSLIILMRILPHFPVLAKLSQIIEKKVEKVREEEKNQRQDLFVLASSYIGQLKARAAQMMLESDFHQVTEKPFKATTTSSATGSLAGATVAVQDSLQDSKVAINGADVKGGQSTRQGSSSMGNGTNNTSTTGGNSSSTSSSAMAAGGNATSNGNLAGSSDHHRGGGGHSSTIDMIKKEPSSSSSSSGSRDNNAGGSSASMRESSVSLAREKSSKEIKREERAREKEREREEAAAAAMLADRKREKEKRRDKRDHYDHERESRASERDLQQRDRSERDLSSVSNSSNEQQHGSSIRRSQDPPEHDRDMKRRKVEGSSSSKSKHDDGSNSASQQLVSESKKERSSKTKEKRDKTDEEKELRKERKLGRKRQDRNAEESLLTDKRLRREEEKASKLLSHQNGDNDGDLAAPLSTSSSSSHREKHHHHHLKEKSPSYGGGAGGGGGGGSSGGSGSVLRDHRERSHDRGLDRGDKQYFTKTSRTRSGY